MGFERIRRSKEQEVRSKEYGVRNEQCGIITEEVFEKFKKKSKYLHENSSVIIFHCSFLTPYSLLLTFYS